MGFYIVYHGFGFVLGFVTISNREEMGGRKSEKETVGSIAFWLGTTTLLWLVTVLLLLYVRLVRAREAIHRKIDKRPPKWYDWIFF